MFSQKTLYLLVFLLIFVSEASANLMYSAGTYVPYFNKVQTSNTGATKKFELTPYFGLGWQFHIAGPQYFTPELGYAHWLDNAKKTKKSMVFLHYNFSYVLSPSFLWRYGLTTHWYRIGGDGGTVTLRNGNGYTDFHAPSKTVTSYFTTFNLGAEFFMDREKSLRFDLHMMNANEFENKAYNYLLTINFYR